MVQRLNHGHIEYCSILVFVFKEENREKEFVSAVDPEVLQSFGDVEDIEHKRNIEHFSFIISKLPVLVSSLLKKVMLEGKSHEDIAIEEGVTVGAVRTRLHRAREEFKKSIKVIIN